MESRRIVSHVCQDVQRDRWTYRNHLLQVHGQVIRGGTSTPVRLVGRELEQVWSADYVRLLDASRRREAMGLPRVTNQEAARRQHDNRIRRERRGRAIARARAYVQQRAARQRVARPPSTPPRRRHLRVASPPPTVGTQTDERPTLQAGHQLTHRHESPTARTYTSCGRCLNCPCRQPKNLSEAQHEYPPYVPHAPPLAVARPHRDPPSCSLKPCWSRGPSTTHEARDQAGRL